MDRSMFSNTLLMSMSSCGRSPRSSEKLSGSSREERSKEPALRSKAPLRSNFRALVSNWKAFFSVSVSTENMEDISKEVPLSAPNSSPVNTLIWGSAICCCTMALDLACSMTCRVRSWV